MPVVRPEAYNDKTACIDVYKAGTLKVSNNICAAVSRFCRGFKGASVSSTGCFDADQPFAPSLHVRFALTSAATYLFTQRL